MTKEPVATSGAIQTVILATIGLLIAFNAWNPTDTQIAAIIGVYGALVVLLASITRSKVTPVK